MNKIQKGDYFGITVPYKTGLCIYLILIIITRWTISEFLI